MLATHADARPFERPLTVTTAGAASQPDDHRPDERARRAHRSRLRPHRDLRSVHRLRLAARMGGRADGASAPGCWPARASAYVGADPIRVVDDEHARRSPRRRDHGRGRHARQQRDGGLLRRSRATEQAFRGGWFHSGDLGVWHADGYIELRDRAKDIIISGGENISTIEVEQAVVSHQAVLECAVVAMPDEKWGERPKAFVVLREGARRRARRDHRACQGRHRPLQGPGRGRVPGRASQDVDRQGPEVRAPRARVGRPREVDQLSRNR